MQNGKLAPNPALFWSHLPHRYLSEVPRSRTPFESPKDALAQRNSGNKIPTGLPPEKKQQSGCILAGFSHDSSHLLIVISYHPFSPQQSSSSSKNLCTISVRPPPPNMSFASKARMHTIDLWVRSNLMHSVPWCGVQPPGQAMTTGAAEGSLSGWSAPFAPGFHELSMASVAQVPKVPMSYLALYSLTLSYILLCCILLYFIVWFCLTTY